MNKRHYQIFNYWNQDTYISLFLYCDLTTSWPVLADRFCDGCRHLLRAILWRSCLLTKMSERKEEVYKRDIVHWITCNTSTSYNGKTGTAKQTPLSMQSLYLRMETQTMNMKCFLEKKKKKIRNPRFLWLHWASLHILNLVKHKHWRDLSNILSFTKNGTEEIIFLS